MGLRSASICKVSLTGLCMGIIPLGMASYPTAASLRQWLTRRKSNSLDSPLSGKQALCLFASPGRKPAYLGAMVWSQSWS
eukprot:14630692-Heterocapsa_arctica.AAC.1